MSFVRYLKKHYLSIISFDFITLRIKIPMISVNDGGICLNKIAHIQQIYSNSQKKRPM